MNTLTIAKRLALGFSAFFLMLVASSALSLLRLGSVNDLMEEIVTKDWQKTVLAKA